MKTAVVVAWIGCLTQFAISEDNVYVPALEVGTKYILTGVTGKPIGAKVVVEGVVRSNHPYEGATIHVAKIDDKVISSPIMIEISRKHLDRVPIGHAFRIEGVEELHIARIELLNQPDSGRVNVGNCGFQIFLVPENVALVSPQRQPNDPQPKDPQPKDPKR